MGISSFVSKLATAGSGKSMARALMLLLVTTTCTAMLICAWKYGFGDPMAKAVASLATALGLVWGVSKTKWGRVDAPKVQGTPDEETK